MKVGDGPVGDEAGRLQENLEEANHSVVMESDARDAAAAVDRRSREPCEIPAVEGGAKEVGMQIEVSVCG
jgi:hypothetical protein